MSDIGDTRCYSQIIHERANQRYGSLLRSLGGLTRLANQSRVYPPYYGQLGPIETPCVQGWGPHSFSGILQRIQLAVLIFTTRYIYPDCSLRIEEVTY